VWINGLEEKRKNGNKKKKINSYETLPSYRYLMCFFFLSSSLFDFYSFARSPKKSLLFIIVCMYANRLREKKNNPYPNIVNVDKIISTLLLLLRLPFSSLLLPPLYSVDFVSGH